MKSLFLKYKGIHPGVIIERELKKRSLKQRPFSLLLNEHPQTFNAITKGRRGVSTQLALKIEREFGFEEGTLVLLQAFYDIAKAKELETVMTPNLSILSKSLFWDTDVNRIDWMRQRKSVINRVFERGNSLEKNEIIRFYGKEIVDSVLQSGKKVDPYSPILKR
jgi:addiction module HigA family antidote